MLFWLAEPVDYSVYKMCIRSPISGYPQAPTDDVESYRKLLILLGLWITRQMMWNPKTDDVESKNTTDEVESSL